MALSDTPDVECRDPATARNLFLEITLIEDVPRDVRYALGRGNQPISPSTRMALRSFFNDSVPELVQSLEKKLLSDYGSDTALVMRQVSPLWGPNEWAIAADQFREEVFRGREHNYGAGVWIICTDSSTWPASDALFCVHEGDARS